MRTTFDEPNEERGPALSQETLRGTHVPMEASDTKTYTVSDSFRISWINDHLRRAGTFKSMRQCINKETGEIDQDAVRVFKPFLSYLLHQEQGVIAEDSINTKVTADANFGRDDLYVTLKVTL